MSPLVEDGPKFSDTIIWRILILSIFAAALTVGWPISQKILNSGFFPDPRIEITGFKPHEPVVMEKSSPFGDIKSKAKADESGKVIFDKVSSGNWRVTKGGSEKLRGTSIRVFDRHGIFTKHVEHYTISVIFKRGS